MTIPMEPIELTAASLDEALTLAASQLGVEKSQVTLTVLEESKGLFGKTSVKVRAEAKAGGAAEAKAEKPKRGAKAKKAAEEVAPEPVTEEVAEDEEDEEVAPVEEVKPVKKGRSKKSEEAPADAPVAAASGDGEATEKEDVVATEDDATALVDMLNEVLESGDIQARGTVREIQNQYVHITVEGRDASHLIGRRGDVLNALQYWMNVVSARNVRNGVRVVLDSADYRERRRAILVDLALQIAGEVVERSEEAVLDALPAFERRVVHQALQDFEGIVTYSEGEEPNRRVVIAPAEG